jgi:hypothetical protein
MAARMIHPAGSCIMLHISPTPERERLPTFPALRICKRIPAVARPSLARQASVSHPGACAWRATRRFLLQPGASLAGGHDSPPLG